MLSAKSTDVNLIGEIDDNGDFFANIATLFLSMFGLFSAKRAHFLAKLAMGVSVANFANCCTLLSANHTNHFLTPVRCQ